MSDTRGFSSSFGAIMAAVGSSVGLGNIWRFPYITGQYGGGAFIIVYLIFVFFIGMMIMLTEFVIGRRAQSGPVKAYPKLRPDRSGWRWLGIFGICTAFLILSLYVVISGWTLNYAVEAVTGRLSGLTTPEQAKSHFDLFSASSVAPTVYLLIFIAITALVIIGGVRKGIEAVSKVLMPVLVGLLLVLCVRSLTLPGASQGLNYLFHPDFSKLTSEGVLAALGQALFSLSVGMGIMVVYGSYIPVSDSLLKSSVWITVCDTLIAVLAGVAIFPAVFSCGLNPEGGPGLVFKVLPIVFNSMGSIGVVFSAIFFMLLVLAALTSAISLLEALVATMLESGKMGRVKAAVLFTVLVFVGGSVCALSYGPLHHIQIGGRGIFDLVDRINSIYLPPLCALGTVVFLGWFMPKSDIKDELSNHGTLSVGWFKLFYFLVRFVAPAALLLVLVTGILQS